MPILTTIFRQSRIQEWSKMLKKGSRKYWRMKMARLPSYTKPRKYVSINYMAQDYIFKSRAPSEIMIFKYIYICIDQIRILQQL